MPRPCPSVFEGQGGEFEFLIDHLEIKIPTLPLTTRKDGARWPGGSKTGEACPSFKIATGAQKKRPAEAGLFNCDSKIYAPGGGALGVVCGVVVGGVLLGGLVDPGAGELGFAFGVEGVVPGVLGVVCGVVLSGVVCGVGVVVVFGVVPGVAVPGVGAAVPGVGAAVPGVVEPGCVVPGCVVPG